VNGEAEAMSAVECRDGAVDRASNWDVSLLARVGAALGAADCRQISRTPSHGIPQQAVARLAQGFDFMDALMKDPLSGATEDLGK
jgi:hypothetical protein